jgi:hypothetical protein
MKTKTVTVIEVEYNELDKAINEFYGKPSRTFSVVADQELGNDSQKEITVSKEPLDKWDQAKVGAFKNLGAYGFSLGSLLQDMANAGAIEPGTYLIKVCW